MASGERKAQGGGKRGAPGRGGVDAEALERLKRASVGQLLFRAARRLNEQTLARVEERTGLAVRPSHTALFPHIDLAGTRQSTLAERLGVSKQAVNKLVGELIEMGVLERIADPTDARAALVRFSTRKGRTLLDGLAMLASVDQELEEALGPRRYRALHEGLLGVERWLDEQDGRGGGED